MNVEKKRGGRTPSRLNKQQQKQKKTTFDCYSLRVMQGVVRLTLVVCIPISKLSNKFKKMGGGARNGQLNVISLLTCSISLLDTSFLKYFIKCSCSILFYLALIYCFRRPVYTQEVFKLIINIQKQKKGFTALLCVKLAWCHCNVIMSYHFKDAVLYKVVKGQWQWRLIFPRNLHGGILDAITLMRLTNKEKQTKTSNNKKKKHF